VKVPKHVPWPGRKHLKTTLRDRFLFPLTSLTSQARGKRLSSYKRLVESTSFRSSPKLPVWLLAQGCGQASGSCDQSSCACIVSQRLANFKHGKTRTGQGKNLTSTPYRENVRFFLVKKIAVNSWRDQLYIILVLVLHAVLTGLIQERNSHLSQEPSRAPSIGQVPSQRTASRWTSASS